MRAHTEVLSDIFRVVRDHDAGVLSDWPDGFTAGCSEAVYYVLEQRDAARLEAASLD